MIIRVRLFSLLRSNYGRSVVDVETDRPLSLRELISEVTARTGPGLTDALIEGEKIRKGTILLVDGRNVLHGDGLATMVDGAKDICFFPPSGGG
ncbi:MAG TPA: hypothetical protein PLP29_01060 [Candidatus Ozemobacteraceae bacterium]|nr:hypothetical protein [Candidatus Ozemobacteraceae bacterium]